MKFWRCRFPGFKMQIALLLDHLWKKRFFFMLPLKAADGNVTFKGEAEDEQKYLSRNRENFTSLILLMVKSQHKQAR